MKSNERPQYFGKDFNEAMSLAKNYRKWILDEIRPYLGNVLAEVGAGIGNFSELLLELQENHLFAFEPSSNMYSLLKDRFRNNNQINTINDFFSKKYISYKNSFDTVIYINVLEHIENDKQELFYVYKALRKKGHVIIFVPALSFLYGELDRKIGHYRRYFKKELIELSQQAGFKTIKVKYFDIVGIIPWYITVVLLKKTVSAGNVSQYDRLVVPIMQKIERFFPPPFGKNLLLISQKT